MAVATISRVISGTVTTLAVLVAAWMGYRFVRAGAAAEVYRQRLVDLSESYDALRDTYNESVRRSAVTELLVKDGSLSVRVRAPDGQVREVPTPYDPRGEIYVDFVVVDGRLWIRRVFDAQTPPAQGVVIDPALGAVAWNENAAQVGKAVYRALDEGRWIVSVTGQGALGLVRAPGGATDLVRAPDVKDYEAVAAEADDEVGRIGLGEMWRHLTE